MGDTHTCVWNTITVVGGGRGYVTGSFIHVIYMAVIHTATAGTLCVHYIMYILSSRCACTSTSTNSDT